MISGVATNLKSRLSQFNSSGSGSSHLSPGNLSSHHHQSDGSKVVSALHSPARSNTSSGSDGTAQASASSLSNVKRHSLGEQPASVIPLTVPGADATMPSFPYGNFPLSTTLFSEECFLWLHKEQGWTCCSVLCCRSRGPEGLGLWAIFTICWSYDSYTAHIGVKDWRKRIDWRLIWDDWQEEE